MKVLTDESIQQGVTDLLGQEEHDALHVVAIGLGGASDDQVLAAAKRDGRILVTAHTVRDHDYLSGSHGSVCSPFGWDTWPTACAGDLVEGKAGTDVVVDSGTIDIVCSLILQEHLWQGRYD